MRKTFFFNKHFTQLKKIKSIQFVHQLLIQLLIHLSAILFPLITPEIATAKKLILC